MPNLKNRERIEGEDVYFYGTVDSTMDTARSLVDSGREGVVVAESQLEGRGRYGRKWLSGPGGLYFSYIFDGSGRRGFPLSEAASLALVYTMEAFGIDCRIKFFNDIISSGRKIAGILIEKTGDIYIVGVGVNINNELEEFDDRISARDITGSPLCLRSFLAEFIAQFKKTVDEFSIDEQRCRALWAGKLIK